MTMNANLHRPTVATLTACEPTEYSFTQEPRNALQFTDANSGEVTVFIGRAELERLRQWLAAADLSKDATWKAEPTVEQVDESLQELATFHRTVAA